MFGEHLSLSIDACLHYVDCFLIWIESPEPGSSAGMYRGHFHA